MTSFSFCLTVLFAFTISVYGSIIVPASMDTIPSKSGMISAQVNNSLYLFGGQNSTVAYSNELYKLTLTDSTYSWEILPQTNTPSGTIFGKGYITSDKQHMVIMGGITSTTKTSMVDLQIYTYDFLSQTWTPGSMTTDNGTFNNRLHFSATYNPSTQETFVYGGCNTADGKYYSDFFKLDANFKVTSLSGPSKALYGHTASLTSDEKIVVLGGVTSDATGKNILADMQSALVYNIATNIWETVTIQAATGNVYPSSRSSHIAAINSDDQIIIFGGDTDSTQTNKQYFNDIATLDSKTWTWNIDSSSGTPPPSRSLASGGLLDGKNLTIAFGQSSSTTYYNDINAYSSPTKSWEAQLKESPSNASTSGNGGSSSDSNSSNSNNSTNNSSDSNSAEPSSQSHSGPSAGLIAGVVVAVVVVILIIFLVWKFKFGSGIKSWLKDRAS